MKKIAFIFISLTVLRPVFAGQIYAAVASNFKPALEELANRYHVQSDNTIKIIATSTGKHYAQIKHGAPFDIFFAADSKTPEKLEVEGFTLAGSRFTYAIGKLVFLSNKAQNTLNIDDIKNTDFKFLAIANPRLAPYGKAAKEVLVKLGSWAGLQSRIVQGENINQAFQFIKSGNADAGFVAYSQVIDKKNGLKFSLVPDNFYQPILQQAVILKDSETVRDFVRFVKSGSGLNIIKQHGYTVPGK